MLKPVPQAGDVPPLARAICNMIRATDAHSVPLVLQFINDAPITEGFVAIWDEWKEALRRLKIRKDPGVKTALKRKAQELEEELLLFEDLEAGDTFKLADGEEKDVIFRKRGIDSAMALTGRDKGLLHSGLFRLRQVRMAVYWGQ